MSKWFGLLIGVFMRKDYENSLENIKRNCEVEKNASFLASGFYQLAFRNFKKITLHLK